MLISWRSTLEGYVPVQGLVGADVSRLPFLSGFGSLVRLLRLNCCTRNELFMATGVRNDQRRSLLRSTMGEGATQRTLVKTLGITPDIAKHWNEDVWCPATVDWNWREVDWALRICPCCALIGYHCVLFQMPWIAECPWHGDHLITRCKHCQRPFAPMLEADRGLLMCECGHDAFSRVRALDVPNHFPSDRASDWLSGYLAWCAENAARCAVITTSAPVEVSLCGACALFKMPILLSGHNGQPRHRWPIHIDRIRPLGREDARLSPLLPWTEMLKRWIIKLTDLPGGLHRQFQCIGDELANALQRRSMVTFAANNRSMRRASPPGNPLGVQLADKVKLWPMPMGQRAQNGSTWLNLCSVLPEALELCTKLIAEIDATRVLGAKSATAWSAKLDEQHCWKPVLLSVLQVLIRRGYAWGLRHVLAKQVREMHTDERIAPQRRVPVLALTHGPLGITGAEIAWVRPSPVPRLGEDALSLPRRRRRTTQPAAKKRQRR